MYAHKKTDINRHKQWDPRRGGNQELYENLEAEHRKQQDEQAQRKRVLAREQEEDRIEQLKDVASSLVAQKDGGENPRKVARLEFIYGDGRKPPPSATDEPAPSSDGSTVVAPRPSGAVQEDFMMRGEPSDSDEEKEPQPPPRTLVKKPSAATNPVAPSRAPITGRITREEAAERKKELMDRAKARIDPLNSVKAKERDVLVQFMKATRH